MENEYDCLMNGGEGYKVEICECPECHEQVRLKLGIDFVKGMIPGGAAY